MDINIQRISRSQILLMAAVAVILWAGGCADPFGEKTAGRQAETILASLGTMKTAPEPNIPMPEIHKVPPRIVEQVVGGKREWRLFYFCKYHTSEELKAIVNAQFATKIFEKPDKPPTNMPDYTVSSNPATNQLIARCPAKADVDAVLEVLQETDVPPVQVKINCIISEIYADKTLDRQTSLQIQDLFGEDIWMGASGQKFGQDVAKLVEEGDVIPAFPGASIRELGRAKMGLKIGYWSEKHNFLALVDLLESKGYLKILMNPTLEVVNGKTATVMSSQHVPLQETYITGGTVPNWVESKMEYVDVVDSLKITPHVFADGFIGLETDILLGSKLTPEGVKQLPIITKKEIENKENRIRQGESLVIGGIRKSEKRDVVRGVPGLKDIPGLGLLFSSRDFEERVVETIFILTPTISTGGVPRTGMTEDVKRKHEPPAPTDANEALADPFGFKARERELQQKTLQAEEARLQAEKEKAQARSDVREAQAQTQRAKTEAETARAKLDQLTAEAEKIKAAADKAIADANAVKTAAEKAKSEADAKTKAAEKAKEQAGKAEPGKPKEEAGKGEAKKPKEEPGKAPTEENKAGT